MSTTIKHIYEFGPFRLDTKRHALLRDGDPVPLTLKSFKTLLLLVENGGDVVERTELMERVWPNAFVEDANLTQQVFTLRKVLGTDQNGRQYVETVPKVGYRFAASVTRVPDGASNRADKNQAEACIAEGTITPLHKTVQSIAVLPLANGNKDSDTEYLSDRVTESIISNRSQLPQLRVMARSTVSQYEGSGLDPQCVGRDLNVQAVVPGRRIKLESLIFSLELVDVTDGTQLSGSEYKRRLSDIFEVQREISTAIIEEIANKLTMKTKTISSNGEVA